MFKRNKRGYAIAIAIIVLFLVIIAITLIPPIKQTIIELFRAWRGTDTSLSTPLNTTR